MKKIIILFITILSLLIGTVSVSATTDNSEDFNTDSSETRQAGALYYKFSKSSQADKDTSASVLKVSADVTGPGTVTATFSKTTSKSLSISMSSAAESQVKATISGSYGSSLTNSLGYSLEVAKGKKGYLAFQPYRRVVKGTLKTYNSAYSNINGGLIQSQSVTAKYPQKLANGTADGHYFIQY